MNATSTNNLKMVLSGPKQAKPPSYISVSGFRYYHKESTKETSQEDQVSWQYKGHSSTSHPWHHQLYLKQEKKGKVWCDWPWSAHPLTRAGWSPKEAFQWPKRATTINQWLSNCQFTAKLKWDHHKRAFCYVAQFPLNGFRQSFYQW